MSYLVGNVPFFSAYLKKEFLYNNTKGFGEFVVCEVFGFSGIQRKAPAFYIMTEFGSIHARVPLHYLVSRTDYKEYPLDYLSIWDCYSYNFSVVRYEYLKNSKCQVIMKDKSIETGTYMFTVDWADNNEANPGSYSEMAESHKCHHCIKLDSGMFAMQPNNRIWWFDGGAFINPAKRPTVPDWMIFQSDYSCEQTGWKWDTGDDERVYYEFDKRVDD